MDRLTHWISLWSQVADAPRRPARAEDEPADKSVPWTVWIRDPRSAVLLSLSSIILIGGGRRLLMGWNSRKAIEKLQGDDPTPEDIEAAGQFGRDGIVDLFRLLETATTPASRIAAGKALVELWRSDDLIVEEEKALLRRGAQIDWIGRRRYPRDLQAPIEIGVSLRVPFLDTEGEAPIRAQNVEWSYRVTGAHRASLEEGSAWQTVNNGGPARFTVDPRDFEGRGPHRLVLIARIRTMKLKDNWEFELPHLPFSFEFDPLLDLTAICATDDDHRAGLMSAGVRLVSLASDLSVFSPLNSVLVLRNAPRLMVDGGLPCDVAHRVSVEFEGVDGRVPAGTLVATEGSLARENEGQPIVLESSAADLPLDRPGSLRMRAHLVPDPQLGWATADVRSLWPRSITTEWAEVQVVRR